MAPTKVFVLHPCPLGLPETLSHGFGFDLVSVVMSSWEKDIRVHMVVAKKVHDGSHEHTWVLGPT